MSNAQEYMSIEAVEDLLRRLIYKETVEDGIKILYNIINYGIREYPYPINPQDRTEEDK